MIDEENSQDAIMLLKERYEGEVALIAPTLLRAEVANTLYTYVKRSIVERGDAELSLKNFSLFPLTYVETDWEALVEAFSASLIVGLSVYDAVYLVLAKKMNASLVTSDREILKKGDKRFQVRELGS